MNRNDTTTTTTRRTSTSHPHSWLRRGAAAVLAGAGIAGTMVFTGAGTAMAASAPISKTPTFSCYSGSINIDKPQLSETGGSVTWEPEIDRWSNGKWVFDNYGAQQTVPNTLGGELELYNEPFNAWHNTYFKVEDWFYTAATGWVYVQAQALVGGAPMFSSVCKTS